MAEPIESGMTESVNAHVLIGFAESLPAPEVAWSLTDAGFRVTAFGRRGAKPLLRHCSEVRIVPVESPERDVAAAQRDLEHAIAEDRPAVFLPIDDVSLWLCGRIGEGTETLMPAKDHVRLALDKELQIEHAVAAGFSVAPTQIGTASEIRAGRHVDYSLILKPANAAEERSGGLERLGPAICADDGEFDEALERFGDRMLIAQPLLRGSNEGLFGLATAAGVQAWSAHRRLRMVDPHGSGSSACASTRVPEDLLGPASRFIEGVGWHGMFMFEVLRDADGIPWFIEFNGRAWGSMALARRIGFEYPAWTVQAALDPHRRIDAPPIREGVVCRHLGMDLRHAFVVFRGPSSRAVEWPSRWQTLRDVLTFRRGQTWYNARRGCRIVFVEDTALAVLDLGGRVAKRLRDVTSRRRRRSTSTRVAPRSAVVTPRATGLPGPVEMLAFLWSGQEGLFELARKDGLVYERQLYTRDAALASLAGNDVFGPVARVPRDSAQVVEEGNVLWADIDEADGLDERLATRVSVAPSVLLDSGNRGFWAFWKLNRPIPAAELESLNRGLAHQLGGDVGSVQRTQLARLPGSRRKETGRVAKVVAFAPVSYDPQQLAAVRETRIGRRLRAAVARLR